MSRPLRLEFPGRALPRHQSWPRTRRRSFATLADRRHFLNLLASVIADQAWLLHSYCLMGNHYHLLVETARPTLSRGMHSLNCPVLPATSTAGTSARPRTRGPLQGDRRAEAGALARAPSIHRAQSCPRRTRSPSGASWPWSNYRATSGATLPPPWLEVGATLSLFSAFGSGAIGAYVAIRRRRRAQRRASPLERVRRQIYLGDQTLSRGDVRPREGDAARITRSQRSHRIPAVVEIDEDPPSRCERMGHRRRGALRTRRRRREARRDLPVSQACGKSAREIGDAFGIKRGRVGNIMAEIQKKRASLPAETRIEKLVSRSRGESRRAVSECPMWQVET